MHLTLAGRVRRLSGVRQPAAQEHHQQPAGSHLDPVHREMMPQRPSLITWKNPQAAPASCMNCVLQRSLISDIINGGSTHAFLRLWCIISSLCLWLKHSHGTAVTEPHTLSLEGKTSCSRNTSSSQVSALSQSLWPLMLEVLLNVQLLFIYT